MNSLIIIIAITLFILFIPVVIYIGTSNSTFFKFLISALFSIIASSVVVIFYLSQDWFANTVLTIKKLFRFENLSHPLLLQLSYQAPGTFHHSINVAILAQKAAKSIGADSLLVRVAAYYHDVGKLDNPLQFIENQSGEEIPRTEDAESIRDSAQKIIDHAKNGLKIANEHKLPDEIKAMIAQHHGTTKALYFYELAKEKGLKIKKTDFCYAGPKPSTKEAAILMLADSCEAAARAIPNLTMKQIEKLVNSVVEDRIAEKQFTKINLLPNELAKIKESLILTLFSIYHQRLVKEL